MGANLAPGFITTRADSWACFGTSTRVSAELGWEGESKQERENGGGELTAQRPDAGIPWDPIPRGVKQAVSSPNNQSIQPGPKHWLRYREQDPGVPAGIRQGV